MVAPPVAGRERRRRRPRRRSPTTHGRLDPAAAVHPGSRATPRWRATWPQPSKRSPADSRCCANSTAAPALPGGIGTCERWCRVRRSSRVGAIRPSRRGGPLRDCHGVAHQLHNEQSPAADVGGPGRLRGRPHRNRGRVPDRALGAGRGGNQSESRLGAGEHHRLPAAGARTAAGGRPAASPGTGNAQVAGCPGRWPAPGPVAADEVPIPAASPLRCERDRRRGRPGNPEAVDGVRAPGVEPRGEHGGARVQLDHLMRRDHEARPRSGRCGLPQPMLHGHPAYA